jgi:hypothetical protein
MQGWPGSHICPGMQKPGFLDEGVDEPPECVAAQPVANRSNSNIPRRMAIPSDDEAAIRRPPC